jgi:hypothetical protein
MASYVLPQVLVYQEFAEQPTAAERPLPACIIGEQYDLHRYSSADEKAAIEVTSAYDPDAQTCYSWPGRQAGGVVDLDYTKVFIDDALLEYYNDPSGSGSAIAWIAPGKNRIRAASLIFKTANGYTRSAAFLRDVQVGDRVKLLASACGDPVTFWANVTALIADKVSATIAAATVDVDNQEDTTPATSNTQSRGPYNLVDVDSVDGASYDGIADGNPEETYTIEVIGASTGGDATTAILRVTSASGNDNVSSLVPAAFGAPTDIGTRGLTVTFDNDSGSSSSGTTDMDDFQLHQSWVVTVSQSYNAPVPTSGGTYVGASDTTYVVEVTTGGIFPATPYITVSTTTGVDVSGPTAVTGSAVAVAIGSQGATMLFTGTAMCKGDRFYAVVTAETDGAVRTIALSSNLPDSLRGICDVDLGGGSSSSSSGAAPDLDLTLYIQKDTEITELRTGLVANWSQTATQICLEEDIEAYDASWVSGGTQMALPVKSGVVYVEHRDRLPTNCSEVNSLTDVSEVPTALGPVHPDNPLAYGVYKALQNSNGEAVKYVGVCGASYILDLDDWLEALELLKGRDDVYGLVPLTQDQAVLAAVLAHCDSQSSPTTGRWRICWLNKEGALTIGIYTGSATAPVLATILDDPDTTGTQYTLVEATDGLFETNHVRAGDTVRAGYTSDGMGGMTYSEYTVDEVLSEESLRLLTGPAAPVNTPSKIEVWRTQTKTELAATVSTYPGLFSNRRAYLVWPDQVGDNGTTVAGYFLCAALAGLRSGVLPHQGLTNVAVLGFDDFSRTTPFFSETQLNTLAASGYWIVTVNATGDIYSRHQLSTGDQDNLFEREQNITTNLDHISYLFLDRMRVYIGRGNVTDTMINILRGEILSIIATLENTITVARLGPQVITATIKQLEPHATLRDRVVARIELELPFPLNNLELYLIAV